MDVFQEKCEGTTTVDAVFRRIFDETQEIISGGSYLVLISATKVRACRLDDI